MRLIIYCEECTIERRKENKYAVVSFENPIDAIFHINQYQHKVRIELEPDYEDD